METTGNPINIQISDKAASFVKSRRLTNPVILINLGFRSSGGDSCGDGCGGGGGGGGGCDEGKSGPKTAFVNAIIIDGGKPGTDFVKVDTSAGIPVYLARRVYNAAQKSGTTLIVNVKGMVMKKLSLEGLDLTAV